MKLPSNLTKNFHLYLRAEQLLLESALSGKVLEHNFTKVCQHFGDDIDHSRLKYQLAILDDVVGHTGSTSLMVQDIHQAILT